MTIELQRVVQDPGGSFRIRRRLVVLDYETLYGHGKPSVIL